MHSSPVGKAYYYPSPNRKGYVEVTVKKVSEKPFQSLVVYRKNPNKSNLLNIIKPGTLAIVPRKAPQGLLKCHFTV
jgi:hypothetical protein